MTQTPHRAIVRITVAGKNISRINYSRRMYAIIRRYTPNGVEGGINECFAELTGLRTFFKMTYAELVDNIRKDLTSEIGVQFSVRVATVAEYDKAKNGSKKIKVSTSSVSTYTEMNRLFAGKSYVKAAHRSIISTARPVKKIRLTVPFLGKVN